jgi:hypothetical protein
VDAYDLKALVKVGTVDVGQQAGGIAFWKMGAAIPQADGSQSRE